MSLININNATSTYGTVRSIQLQSPSHGGRYLSAEMSDNAIAAHLMAISHGSARIQKLREAASLLGNWITMSSDRALYGLQKSLNDSIWAALQVTVQVEFGLRWTGHGEFPAVDDHCILLVKTTWQEEAEYRHLTWIRS